MKLVQLNGYSNEPSGSEVSQNRYIYMDHKASFSNYIGIWQLNFGNSIQSTVIYCGKITIGNLKILKIFNFIIESKILLTKTYDFIDKLVFNNMVRKHPLFLIQN